MTINFTTAYSALYSRAATDSAGSAVRALVGSVFDGKELNNLSGKTLPYLVWRSIDPDGQSEQMTNINGGWYAYIAPGDTGGDRKLTTIATAVYALYSGESRLAIAGGNLHALAPSAPFFDSPLGLRGIRIPIYWRVLG
jgi:hypothetical protein